MCSNEFVFAVTALAASLAENRTDDEISLLGAIFTQLGDTLSTISARNALCSAADNKDCQAKLARKQNAEAKK